MGRPNSRLVLPVAAMAGGKYRANFPLGVATTPPTIGALSRTGVQGSAALYSGLAWGTEDWESKTVGAAPVGSNTDTGGIRWADSHFTTVVNSRAYEGSRSLQFAFGAYNGSIAEQRFDLNREVTDIWLAYYVYIPSNYAPANKTGAGSQFAGGNKEIVLYSEDYSNAYPTLILGSWYKQNGPGSGDGSMWQSGSMRYIDRFGTQVWHQFDDYDGRPKLVDASTDLGTWQLRILHFTMPTTATSNNGVCEYWVKRANGVTDKIIDEHNGAWYGANPGSTGTNRLTGGYMLGAAGTLWASDMNMNVDKVRWSDTNIWGVS